MVIVVLVIAAVAVNSAFAGKVDVSYSTSTARAIGFSLASQGMEYLIVNMSVHDVSCSSFEVDPFYFQTTINGVTYSDDAATFLLNDTIQSVTLGAGGTTVGSVAFQVPTGSSGAAFGYTGPGVCTVSWAGS